MDIEHSTEVNKLLGELIYSVFGTKLSDELDIKYKSYFSRFLSSRVGSASNEAEETTLMRMNQQALKISEELGKGDNWGQTRAARLQELALRLNKLKAIQNRHGMFKLLSMLSNSDKEAAAKGKGSPIFKTSPPKTAQDLGLKQLLNAASSVTEGSAGFQLGRGMESLTTKHTSNDLSGLHSLQNQQLGRLQKPSMLSNPMAEEENKLETMKKQLIRELLFVFQGIESTCIKLQKGKDEFELDSRIGLDRNEREIVLRLCEMGTMYLQIKNIVDELASTRRGLVEQSFCYAVKEELNDYYRFVATLENLRDNGLTSLKSLYLWTLEPMECLKWILILCDVCKPFKGSQLLTVLFTYSSHGSVETQQLVQRLLIKSIAPFMNFLKNWVYSGEVVDPSGDFFIEIVKAPPNQGSLSLDTLWSRGFQLRHRMIPSFMSRATAEQILIAGKSKAFLKAFGCQWQLKVDFIKVENLVSFQFMDGLKFRTMENWVNRIANEYNAKVKELLIKDHAFFEHCKMIKNFLLFGKGEFINCFIEGASPYLNEPANSVLSYNLVLALELTKSQMLPQHYRRDLVERIGVYIFEKAEGGNTAWERFSLKYDLKPPLTTVFQNEQMTSYFRIFRMICKIRKLIIALTRYSFSQHREIMQKKYSSDLQDSISINQALRHHMLLFLNTLQSYLLLEVIETEWSQFLRGVEEAHSIDEIIHKHEDFLAVILDKTLLSENRRVIYLELTTLLNHIENYNQTQTKIQNTLEEIEISDRRLEGHDDRLDSDEGDYLEDDEGSESRRIQDDRRAELKHLEDKRNALKLSMNIIKENAKLFNNTLQGFLEHLENDQKLKTLSFKFDFNEFYKTQRHSSPFMRGGGGNTSGSASGFGFSANSSGFNMMRRGAPAAQQREEANTFEPTRIEAERGVPPAPGQYYPGAFRANRFARDG